MSLDRLLEHDIAFFPARVTRSDSARSQPMPIVSKAISFAQVVCRRLALHLFRLASCILRCATHLHQHRLIPRTGVWVALSAANLMQRLATSLLLGPKSLQYRRDNHWTSRDGH
jgi:hypothetical protein